MLQLLTAPQVLAAPAHSHRYMVELASIEVVLDARGVPVPASTKILDVLVVDPTAEAIATFLKAIGHLNGFKIVRHWQEEDCDCF